ncbi:unnamed protein product [Paramecium sonneborni]|uniref:Transmembrane protein n=1 Tax=Paramecium sonneborni TaxID=65129 RepID=A0A8S1LR54_9CILI|nr:unnamed protein product [Paramecium sonneborni]
MQNYAILIITLLSFILVKLILVKLKIKKRIKNLKHPIEQARRFIKGKSDQQLMQKMQQFPGIIKLNRQKAMKIQQQQQSSCCNIKEMVDIIEYIAILIGILELKKEQQLLIDSLLETVNIELKQYQTVGSEYLQTKQEQFEIHKLYKRKV